MLWDYDPYNYPIIPAYGATNGELLLAPTGDTIAILLDNGEVMVDWQPASGGNGNPITYRVESSDNNWKSSTVLAENLEFGPAFFVQPIHLKRSYRVVARQVSV